MTAGHAPTASRTSALYVVGGLAAAIVASIVVNVLIAVVAHALGASDEFPPLQFGAYGFFTVLGVLAGAAGWAAVRRFSRRPAAVLRWLVPTVVAVSLIPDLGLLVSDSQPGTSVLAVVALMAMHLVIAAIAVPIYRRVMPVADRA